jgi:sugar lactone lactonase YvrE
MTGTCRAPILLHSVRNENAGWEEMAKFDIRHVLDMKAGLGEGPLWSGEHEALFWLDQRASTINRFDPATGANIAWPVPSRPGCFSFCDGGALIAAERGYYRFDFSAQTFEHVCDPPFDPAVFRFNDGKADRQGRFWAGSILIQHKTEGEPEASYFRYDAGTVTEGITGIAVPNGTAFSPDGKTMYRAESMKSTLHAFDYDPATGTPSNQRLLTTIPEGFGLPDGGTVDSEGGLWLALPFGETGKIARYTPDGELDMYFEVPVLVPTMVAFGGKDMATMYITTGRIEALVGKPESPLGGDIFAVELPFRGIPEAMTQV